MQFVPELNRGYSFMFYSKQPSKDLSKAKIPI